MIKVLGLFEDIKTEAAERSGGFQMNKRVGMVTLSKPNLN